MKKDPIQSIPLDRLQLNEGQLDWLPTNPRQWTQTDIDRTKRSLEEDPDFMWDRPVLAVPAPDGSLVAFAGNLRLTAARALGWPNFPVSVSYPETEEDRDAILRRAIKDNGSFGTWDTDELASWDVEAWELEDWGVPEWITGGAGQKTQQQGSRSGGSGAGAGTAKEDDFDENKDGILVRCKPGDVWELGEHRLMCGDSIDLQQVTTLMGGGYDKS